MQHAARLKRYKQRSIIFIRQEKTRASYSALCLIPAPTALSSNGNTIRDRLGANKVGDNLALACAMLRFGRTRRWDSDLRMRRTVASTSIDGPALMSELRATIMRERRSSMSNGHARSTNNSRIIISYGLSMDILSPCVDRWYWVVIYAGRCDNLA